MAKLFKYHGPAILWALFIFIMCTVDLGSVGQSHLFFAGFDKVTHCGFFFVLVVFWANGVTRQQTPPDLLYTWLAIITIVAILYGGIIELLQLYVFTWRDGEWGDFFSDAIGACMGAFSVMLTVKTITYAKK